MKRWDRLSRGFRQLRWGVSVFTGTLSMAAGIFTAGTVQRFRLWKISKLVWIPPAVWTAGGFRGGGRATRRLERSRPRRRT